VGDRGQETEDTGYLWGRAHFPLETTLRVAGHKHTIRKRFWMETRLDGEKMQVGGTGEQSNSTVHTSKSTLTHQE